MEIAWNAPAARLSSHVMPWLLACAAGTMHNPCVLLIALERQLRGVLVRDLLLLLPALSPTAIVARSDLSGCCRLRPCLLPSLAIVIDCCVRTWHQAGMLCLAVPCCAVLCCAPCCQKSAAADQSSRLHLLHAAAV